MRVLIVEDEYLVASVIQSALVKAGMEIVGLAGSVDGALELIAQTTCDAAVLDANLGGVSAAPVADALRVHGAPFLVLSGYDPDQLPSGLAGAPYLAKPCRPDELANAVRGLIRT